VTAPPRVRLAPSPTGYFHVGTARTALYNWCFARQHSGVFVLRIEDTDAERNQAEAVTGILEALRWLGTEWDEGPFFQSDRRDRHRAALARLLDGGHLYACDCTSEAVALRTKASSIPGYDGFCRDRGLEPGPGRALRFRVPDTGETVVEDLVRGSVRFQNSTIADFVVARSDGSPLFVLAVVVDDIEMGITHVIRGEEHLPTTPKAVLLYEALGEVELPAFAHLSVLVNAKRRKLSKRFDRVAIEDYRAQGYLPEAMVNYLALVGWSPRDGREIFSLQELAESFDLSEVTQSPGFFDEAKLSHVNGVYLRRLPTAEFVARSLDFLDRGVDRPTFERLAPLVQERANVLADVANLVDFALGKEFSVDEECFGKAIERDPLASTILGSALDRYRAIDPGQWRAAELKRVLEEISVEVGRKLGKTQAPVRVATMGHSVGLPLFESLEVLGKDLVAERLSIALKRLSASAPTA